MKAAKRSKLEQWEEAWEEYIESLEAYERTEPMEFVRGHKREHRSNRIRYGKARRKLKDLDPEFCERMGIQ